MQMDLFLLCTPFAYSVVTANFLVTLCQLLVEPHCYYNNIAVANIIFEPQTS